MALSRLCRFGDGCALAAGVVLGLVLGDADDAEVVRLRVGEHQLLTRTAA